MQPKPDVLTNVPVAILTGDAPLSYPAKIGFSGIDRVLGESMAATFHDLLVDLAIGEKPNMQNVKRSGKSPGTGIFTRRHEESGMPEIVFQRRDVQIEDSLHDKLRRAKFAPQPGQSDPPDMPEDYYYNWDDDIEEVVYPEGLDALSSVTPDQAIELLSGNEKIPDAAIFLEQALMRLVINSHPDLKSYVSSDHCPTGIYLRDGGKGQEIVLQEKARLQDGSVSAVRAVIRPNDIEPNTNLTITYETRPLGEGEE